MLTLHNPLHHLHQGRREMFRGQLIKVYFFAYLAYRFLTEFIRPEARLWAGLTGYQWACLVLVPVFAGLWVRDARAMRAVELPPLVADPATRWSS